MRRKACIVRVDFHPQLSKNWVRYRQKNGEGKKQILLFLDCLMKRGYRHFVLNIEKPSDAWIAEIIYYYTLSCTELDLIYSIGIWRYENNPCDWLEELPFDWNCVVSHAYHVFFRSDCWYDKYYRMERIYVPIRECWMHTIS